MRLVKEDLWKHPGPGGIIAVTTNSTLRRDGSLVMGRGAAFEATKRIPGIDLECGRSIADYRSAPIYQLNPHYGWRVIRQPTTEKVGFAIFQVKVFWGDAASLDLIQNSVEALRAYLLIHPGHVRLNFPGIGNGKLAYDDVLPIVERLPDWVTICMK